MTASAVATSTAAELERPEAEWHIAPEAQAEAGNRVAFAGEDGDNAERIVGPVAAALARAERWHRMSRSLGVVLGVDNDFAVGTRRDGGQGREVDGRGHDEAFGVVSVFADEVDAARRGKDGRFGLKRARWMRAESWAEDRSIRLHT